VVEVGNQIKGKKTANSSSPATSHERAPHNKTQETQTLITTYLPQKKEERKQDIKTPKIVQSTLQGK